MQACNALGLHVITDRNPHIQYRLHGGNVCGAAILPRQKIAAHIRRILGDSYASASIMIHELLAGYQQNIPTEYVEMLKIFDKSEKVPHRRFKLIILAFKECFSNIYRKALFIIEVMMGKV